MLLLAVSPWPAASVASDADDLLRTWTWSMLQDAGVNTRSFRTGGRIDVVNGAKATPGTYAVDTCLEAARTACLGRYRKPATRNAAPDKGATLI